MFLSSRMSATLVQLAHIMRRAVCTAGPNSVHSWPEPRGSTNNCTTWHFNSNAKSIVSVQYCQFANVFATSFYFAKSRQDLGHGSFASGVATLGIYRILELQMASNKEV